jgi:hypothetical protein
VARGRVPISDRRSHFESKFKRDPSGCWLWTAGMGRGGYGAYAIFQRQLGAHRASWQIYRGEIPDGLWVLHKCDVRNCVNPDHLFLGTPTDNNRDTVQKGRANLEPAARLKREQPFCKHGHERTPENTFRRSDGFVRCRICHRNNGRATYARQRRAA